MSTSITRPRPRIKNAQAVGIAGAPGEVLASPPSGMRPTRRSSDVGLTEYRRKRRFAVTSEPSGDEKPRRKRSRTLAFVVQKHRATRLHYDFRLEWNGVLWSWAVPKGPSLDPSIKRLAMQTEDHPLEYARFEGIIPEGEYGGGTVMIWDEGFWAPMEEIDPARGLDKGELGFLLDGKKLKGSWTLVSTGDRKWLLMKRKDEYASTEDIEETQPRSVRTKRLLADIARDAGGDVEKAATGDPRIKKARTAAKR